MTTNTRTSQDTPALLRARDGLPLPIDVISVDELHNEVGFAEPFHMGLASRNKPFSEWKMELDDAPIFRYLYRNFAPRRHLEFGTWQGTGTTYCLEECPATVWTINPPFGEDKPDGLPAYSLSQDEVVDTKRWAKKVGLTIPRHWRTDSIGFIGRYYLEKNLGNRVCQIYCDSRAWDISQYPDGFFDSVLIDGGHTPEVVLNDTSKALKLVRSGGLLMWHDFCPEAVESLETCAGVVQALSGIAESLAEATSRLFWPKPSFILVGLKR